MLGLGSSITSYPTYVGEWLDTRYLDLDGADGTFAKVVNMANQMDHISAGDDTDIGTNITMSFWVKPTWVMTSSGTNTTDQHVAGVDSSGSVSQENNVPLIAMGQTSTELHRIRTNYQIDTGSSSDRNRLQVEFRSQAGNNKQGDEYYLHADNHGVTGTGTGLDNTGVSTGWWHAGNTGGVNSRGFVHLAFTRGEGEWTIYWNGSALGSRIDIDGGSVDINELVINELWIGKNFTNQSVVPGAYRDIAIFKEELDSDGVSDLYNSGNFFDVRLHANADNLGLYWPCNDANQLGNGDNSAILALKGSAKFKDF